MTLVIDIRVGQHCGAASAQHAVWRRLGFGENCDDPLWDGETKKRTFVV
jgi:hypothetical protein